MFFVYKNFSKLFLIAAFLSFYSFGVFDVNAQAASGTLSFGETSYTFSDQGSTNVDVVYTGDGINAAEIHITLDGNFEIDNFDLNNELTRILENTDTGEIHFGKLTEGDITSGTVLFTAEITGTNCGESGTLSFNEAEIIVPDTDITTTSSSYTVDCSSSTTGGGTTGTTTGTTGTTTTGTTGSTTTSTTSGSSSSGSITSLPNTAEEGGITISKILIPSGMIIISALILGFSSSKKIQQNSENSTEQFEIF